VNAMASADGVSPAELGAREDLGGDAVPCGAGDGAYTDDHSAVTCPDCIGAGFGPDVSRRSGFRGAMSEAVRGAAWMLKRALALVVFVFSASKERQAETKEGIDLWRAGFRFRGAMKIAASQGLHWLLAGAVIYAIVTSNTIAHLTGWIMRLIRIAGGA
jgi:hypothetical protein